MLIIVAFMHCKYIFPVSPCFIHSQQPEECLKYRKMCPKNFKDKMKKRRKAISCLVLIKIVILRLSHPRFDRTSHQIILVQNI